ncbi:MAG TPA: hypothetical protein VF624_18880 [Tepidisphaeraceae bacterium]|jgi:hypothetical protein
MDSNTPTAPRKAASLSWIYPVSFALSLLIIGGGVYVASRGQGYALLSAGAVGLLGVLVTWPIAAALGDRGGVCGAVNDAMTPVYDRMQQFSVMLNEINEHQMLSDRAKSVAYREKDREALRRAIQEDIARRDWEGALVLVGEMDEAFGYKQEAERIREEINQRFADHIRRQISAGVALIDRHTSNQQWAAAQREADRLREQFPTAEDVRSLPNEIEQRRQAHKQKLLLEYNERIAAGDTDGAIATVQKLDFYLTPEEGNGMSESVRNLFKDKLNQLKDRFTDAVHNDNRAESVRLAEQIINEFPNTQMARELREKIDGLRARATEGQPAVVA